MTDLTVIPAANDAPSDDHMTPRAAIYLTDTPDGKGIEVEMRSSHVQLVHSPSNLMVAFLAKYWEVLCTSAEGEYKQALAEMSGKPIAKTALRLVREDGSAVQAAD
jgi:hypothetical protein